VTRGAFTSTLIGFATLSLGGWLGGTVVVVQGMRVLNLVDEPAQRAVSRATRRKSEQAAGAPIENRRAPA
jgi:hypothetical protein